MSDAKVIPPGAGELIGDSPDRRVEIVCDHPALNATWSRFAAGRNGAGLHIHRHHTDLFFVLTGELTVRLGSADDHAQVGPGTLVRVPPYVVHGFRNASDADVTYLNLHAPGRRFNDFMRAMRDGREFDWDQHEPATEGERPAADAAIGETVRTEEREGARETVLADTDEVFVAVLDLAAGAALPSSGAAVECACVLAGEISVAGRMGDRGTWAQATEGGALEATAGDAAARVLVIRAPSPAN